MQAVEWWRWAVLVAVALAGLLLEAAGFWVMVKKTRPHQFVLRAALVMAPLLLFLLSTEWTFYWVLPDRSDSSTVQQRQAPCPQQSPGESAQNEAAK